MTQVTKTHGTSFTVPSNVTSVHLLLRGAPGEGNFGTGTSGEGGIVEGDLAVSPGDVLYFRGSGSGGTGPDDAGDGGDYIDVRHTGTALSDQVAVAAGGGGQAEAPGTPDAEGGDGGADVGQDGADGGGDAFGGGGGDQTSGGAAGGSNATAGQREFGGDGDNGADADGGGGGGGCFGGGGGAEDASLDTAGGGGGGSNLDDGLTSVDTNQRGGWTSSPEVVVTYAETPSVTLDSLTETGETDVRVQASSSVAYDASGEWQVRRNGTLIETDTSDADLDYTDTNAEGGLSNTYEVTRVNASDSDADSASIKVRLETVTGLTVTDTTSTTVDLSCDAVANADSYEWLRATSAGAAYTDYSQVGSTSSPSFTDSGLTDGTEYYYTVRAVVTGDSAFDSRYPGEVTATTGFSAPTLSDVADASQTTLDCTFQREDGNDSGDIIVVVDGVDVATLNYDATSYTVTGLSAATAYEVQIRREVTSATATSATKTQYTKPETPGRPDIQPDQTAQTHTLIFGTLPSGADTIEVLESRDAPASALRDATAFDTTDVQLTSVTPSATSFETDRQDRLSTYTYQLRAVVGSDSEQATSLSPTATASFKTYANYWLALERTDGSTAVRRRTVESGPTYEHSALHHYTHAAPRSDLDASADALADVDVYLGDSRLFRGEFRRFEGDTPSDGPTTATAFGPALPLRRDAPDAPVTYQNTTRAAAIRDYWTRIDTVDVDAVVHDPPTETVENDTLVLSDTFSGFSGLASPAADVPVSASGSLALQQAAWLGVQDDFGGGDSVGSDSSGNPPYHIDSEYQAVSTTQLTYTFTPDHDIPESRVQVVIHRDVVDGAGTLSTLDISVKNESTNATDSLDAGDIFDGGTNRWATIGGYSGGDLSAGTSYTLSITPGDYEFNVDCMGILDAEYGPYTFDDPTSINEKIDGPQLYKPVTVDLTDEPRPYPITEVRIASTVSDTSGAFEYEVTTTGGDASLTATTADATLDFLGADQIGARLDPSVTLGGYGSNTWLADGASGQEITSLDISVTTETIPAIDEVELSGTHYENLQTLHRDSDFRWVVDPTVARVDGLVVDSFVPSDPSVVRQPTWTQIDLKPATETLGYANAITISYRDTNGDIQSFVAPPLQSEVDSRGEVIRAKVPRDDVSTNDQARIAATNELRKRVAEWTQSGRIEAIATADVLPGFPYDVDAFGGATPLDDSVSYRESAERNTMTLQFRREATPFERQLAVESAVQSLRGP